MADTVFTDSILTSIKKDLGIKEDYTHFDSDIVNLINTALSVLFQLGVGPQDTPFRITGNGETWHDFLGDNYDLNMAVSEVFIRVRLVFDPPATSHVTKALQDTLAELDWRAMAAAEEKNTNG